MPTEDTDFPQPLRLGGSAVRPATAHARIWVDGEAVTALAGETVAAAMTAAGLRRFGEGPDGTARGLGCGMGACFTCAVTVDGARRVRACMTEVADGMQVDTRQGPSRVVSMPPRAADHTGDVCDVVIVGAGPAGATAAVAIAAAGLTVTVLDERAVVGGQFFKPLAKSHAFAGAPPDRQFRDGLALAGALARSGAQVLLGATVWDARLAADGRFAIVYDRDSRSHRLIARRVLVATGAVERPWPVPGWTLPGVTTTGAAQTLVRSYRVAPGRRILIAGHGPLNLQLAAELADNFSVVGLVEAAKSPLMSPLAAVRMARYRPELLRDGLKYLISLRNSTIHWGHVLVRIDGRDRVEAATIAAIDHHGRIVSGSERRIPADAVAIGYGFLPVGDVPRLIGCVHDRDPRGSGLPVARCDDDGRTSIPGLFVAGDCRGAWGAGAAIAGGRRAAAAIVADLAARPAGAEAARAARRLDRELAFQRALWTAYAARLPSPRDLADPATLICRCEGLTRADLEPALACGDLAEIKRRTRCGMGLCQGRTCLPLVAALLPTGISAELPAVQPPLKPVEIASAATLPPATAAAPATAPPRRAARRPARIPDATERCEVLVVGGGIVGLCTARELARAGVDVLLLEAGAATGAEASGANAGSLHVQSLAYGTDDFDTPAARRALDLLPLQRDAVGLWRALAREARSELQTDLELHVAGGLCLADDPASLAKLHRKVELERAVGLDVALVDATEARRLLPGLSEAVLAASFSPDEGKLNPLAALPALAALARAAGARVVTQAPVRTLARDGAGFRAATPDLAVTADRVVLAAGAASADLAAGLGAILPIVRTPLQMLVTERLPARFDLLVSHVARRLTLKQARAGNLIIGGGWRAGIAADGATRIELAEFAGNLAVACAAFADLAAVQVIRTWVAVNALPTGGPLIGALPGTPACVVAVTLNGLTLGPVLGRICADLVRGRTPGWDIAGFDPGRPAG